MFNHEGLVRVCPWDGQNDKTEGDTNRTVASVDGWCLPLAQTHPGPNSRWIPGEAALFGPNLRAEDLVTSEMGFSKWGRYHRYCTTARAGWLGYGGQDMLAIAWGRNGTRKQPGLSRGEEMTRRFGLLAGEEYAYK